MHLSIVTTLYQSEDFVEDFYNRITKEAEKITDDYEIIFVNDGSPDKSLKIAIGLFKCDGRVKIIDLSRNFGHHKAIMTGLSNAEGDFVFLIDSDLEEKPELLGQFWGEIQAHNNIDVIYGKQVKRKGGWVERWSGKIFYSLLNVLIDDIDYPADTLTSRMMTKRYVKKVISYKESEYDLWSIFEFAGHSAKSIVCHKGYKKSTSYTFFKKMDMAIHIIASTSKKPLTLVFYLGITVSIMSFLYFIYLIFAYLLFNIPMGWTSIVVLISFLLGVVIFSIGILGIYISVIFLESKKRPIIIKTIYTKNSE